MRWYKFSLGFVLNYQTVENRGFYLFIFFTRMADMSVADKLCKASAMGNLRKVLLLLQNGTDVNGFNKWNRTALQVGINRF